MSQQQQQQQQPKRLDGKVKAVLSGDTLVLSHPTKIFPAIEKTLTLVRIQAPRMAKRNESKEAALAFEAREFLRKKCVGKLVSFQVEYKNAQTGRDYGSVFLDGENLGEAILKQGLAEFKASKKESEEYKDLTDAQEYAKANKLGLWAEQKPKQREIIWSGFDSDKLLKSFKNKPVNVIVEYVMNGSSLRVQLPTGEMVVLQLTGVQCPGLSSKVDDKPSETGKKERVEIGQQWSKEARHYTELRILHRDVTVLFEGVDRGDSLLGTILISNNESSDDPVTFQEELLLKGFAKVAEWSAPKSKYVTRFRKAEGVAKSKKLRLWEGYTEPAATLKSEDQQGFQAKVIEVISGDTIRIRDKNGVEDRISLSSIRAPRFSLTKESEPLGFEARDTLRKAVVGKSVTVRVDYRRQLKRTVTQTKPGDKTKGEEATKQQVEVTEDRRFCTLLVNNKSVAVELVKAGFATVIKHKSGEERSVAYDQLMLAEDEAKKKTKGVHDPKKKKQKPQTINDITQDTLGKVQKYLASLSNKKIKGVVEKVFTGTRFKVLIPKDSLLITFAISAIQTPSLRPRDDTQPKPFAQEAINFAIDELLMREVEIEIKNIDKVGSFVGDLIVNGENFAVTILKNGFGLLQHKIAEKLSNYEQLKEAESVAKDAKKFVWSVDTSVYRPKKQREQQQEDKDAPLSLRFKVVKGETFVVRVTEVLSAAHFYMQRADSVKDIERVDDLLSSVNADQLQNAGTLTEGDIVLALFASDNAWYRAKVSKYNKDKNEATVVYIDYGSSETISTSTIKSLPKDSELAKIKPTAVEAKLAFINLHAENYVDEAKLLFCELTSDRDLEATVEYTEGGIQYVSLVDKSDNTNINQTLVRNGLAFVDGYYKKISEFKSVMGIYDREQTAAKNERYNLWEDGAVYNSDDDDYDN